MRRMKSTDSPVARATARHNWPWFTGNPFKKKGYSRLAPRLSGIMSRRAMDRERKELGGSYRLESLERIDRLELSAVI